MVQPIYDVQTSFTALRTSNIKPKKVCRPRKLICLTAPQLCFFTPAKSKEIASSMSIGQQLWMLNDIPWPDHIQWQPPTDQTMYRTRPFTEYWEVSMEQLRRVWHADRGWLLLRTPGPVPFGLAYVLLVETNPFSELVVIFPDYALSNIPQYFLDFAFHKSS